MVSVKFLQLRFYLIQMFLQVFPIIDNYFFQGVYPFAELVAPEPAVVQTPWIHVAIQWIRTYSVHWPRVFEEIDDRMEIGFGDGFQIIDKLFDSTAEKGISAF
jgi:hypothetical protein